MIQRYVPILKWKQGERIALWKTGEAIKDRMCPAFNVVGKMEAAAFTKQVEKHWGKDRPFYLDFHPTFTGNPITFLNAALSPALMPIISLDKPKAYIKLIEDAVGQLQGLALRIQLGDAHQLSNLIDAVSKISTSTPTDLIVDLWDIAPLPLSILKTLVKPVCLVLDEAKAYPFRRIVVAGASFPERLSVPQGTVSALPRKEWSLWKEVVKTHPHTCFGDYGADDPHDQTYEHAVTIIPTIRYTHEDHWLVVRGVYDPRNPYDYPQFHGLSQTLIDMNEFCGADYSWGDQRIYKCAGTTCTGKGCNHGNMATWVQINTNHHLVFVVHQVANRFLP